MPRRVYAVPEIKRQADETTTEAATAGAVATSPSASTSHYALTDVVPDQHHAELHNLASPDHPDTDLESRSDGDVIAWDAGAGRWVATPPASGISPLEVFDSVGATLLGIGPLTIVTDPGVLFYDSGQIDLHNGDTLLRANASYLYVATEGAATGDESGEGVQLDAGPDDVGIILSEKDSGTAQIYPDNGNNVELKDTGGGLWQHTDGLGDTIDLADLHGVGATTLAGLSDVVITGVADLDVLTYDSGSGDWINAPASSFTPAADPGDIADPTMATAQDVAEKLNDLMAAMRTAGMLV